MTLGSNEMTREEALENVKKFNSTVKNETEEIIAKEVEQSFNVANLFIEDASKSGKTNTMMCFSYKARVDSFDIAINEQEKVVDRIAGNVSSKLRQNGYETTVLNNRALRYIILSIRWG